MPESMRLLKILFIALLCFLPFGEIFSFNVGNDVSLKPLDVFSGVLLVGVVVEYYKINQYAQIYDCLIFFFQL